MNIDVIEYGKKMEAYGIMRKCLEIVDNGLYGMSPKYLKHVVKGAIDDVVRLEGDCEHD